MVLRCLLLSVLVLAGCRGAAEDDHLGALDDFQLTERSGRAVSRDDLKGKVWVAAFFFTRCAGPCSQVSGQMARLQEQWAGRDVVLVSFTVDPDHDTPAVLRDYAAKFQADPQRWLFLTGERDKLYALIQNSFKLGVAQNEGTARKPGDEVLHSTRLVVIDRKGEKRGYFDATDEAHMTKLTAKLAAVLREKY